MVAASLAPTASLAASLPAATASVGQVAASAPAAAEVGHTAVTPAAATSVVAPAAQAAIALDAATYHPTAPVKLLAAVLHAHSAVTLRVAGAHHVPSDATAALVSITTKSARLHGFVLAGSSAATAVTALNFAPGSVSTQESVVRLSDTGRAYLSNGSAGVVTVTEVLEGYYSSDATGLTYHPLASPKALPLSTTGSLAGKSTARVTIAGHHSVPVSARAVVLQIAAGDASAGAISLGDSSKALAPAVAFSGRQVLNGLAITPLAAKGYAVVANSSAQSANASAVIMGYYTHDVAGSLFRPTTPVRVLDTRIHTAAVKAAVKPKHSVVVTLPASVPPPSGSNAVILSIAELSPGAAGSVTATWAGGGHLSTLAHAAGQNQATTLVVPVTSKRTVTLTNASSGSLTLVTSVIGYFSLSELSIPGSQLGTISAGLTSSIVLQGAGGSGPYTFALTTGSVNAALPKWVLLSSSGQLTITPPDGTATAVKAYVTLKDATGLESPSGHLSVTFTVVPRAAGPLPPGALTATAGAGIVTLHWTASPDSTLAGYRVYRSATGFPNVSGTSVNTGLITTTTYVDTSVVAGGTYNYAVVAVDHSNRQSAAVTASSGIVLAPDTGTDNAFPHVTTVTPTPGATGVAVTASVVASVDLPYTTIDPVTLTAANVLLTVTGTATPLAATVTATASAITLLPTAALSPNTGYTFTVGTGVKDLTGHAFLAYTESFTTGAATADAANARLLFNASIHAGTDTETETIHNGGTATMNLTGPTFTTDADNPGPASDFHATLSATVVPVGGSATVSVTFAPAALGPVGAVLHIGSDQPITPGSTIVLRGLGTNGTGGKNEPSLQYIFDTLQLGINSGSTNPAIINMPTGANLVGSEISAQAFTRANTSQPVTFTELASFSGDGPATDPNAIHVSAYDDTSGSNPPNTLQHLFDLANATDQSVNPVMKNVSVFNPTVPFGLAFNWPGIGLPNHTTFSRDAFNTWDPVALHKVRVYPYVDPSGVTEPNAYVVAPEDYISTDSNFPEEFNDSPMLLQNVTPVTGAELQLTNTNGQPFDNRLAFSKIGTPNTSTTTTELTHVTNGLMLRNTGDAPLNISIPQPAGFFIVNGLTLASDYPINITLAPGATNTLTVTFTAIEARLRIGSMVINSNAVDEPSKTISLEGYFQAMSELQQEPTPYEIGQLMGWSTNIPPDGIDDHGHVQADGDEVLSPYWVRSDINSPVSVRQIAAYHGFPNTATMGWNDTAFVTHPEITMSGAWAQSMFPLANGSSSPAQASFTPTASTFGFYVDGEWSDDAHNNPTGDHAEGCVNPCGHHMRFFPVKVNGVVVQGEYMMTMDYSNTIGTNYDYNDNVYLISNVKPAHPAAPADVTATGSDGSVALAWDANAETGIAGYNIYRSTTTPVAMTAPVNGASLVTGTTWVDTTVTDGTTYDYVVQAVYADSGNGSPASAAAIAVPVAPGSFTKYVNFASVGAATPLGYVDDTGSAYNATRGYGWVKQADVASATSPATPLDLTGNGRDRGSPADVRLATFMIMQGTSGVTTPGAWQLVVPNGSYTVTLSVGDSQYFDSIDDINVEGVPAISGFVPTGATPFESATVTVPVTNGLLTIDAIGGTNSKLDYVDVVQVG